MKKIIISFIILLSLFVLSGCVNQPKKVKSKQEHNNTKELELEIMNKNLLSNMPIYKKIDENTTLKIVTAKLERDGKNRDGILVNSDFVYKSFAIPEGIVGRITFKGKLKNNKEDKNLYLYGLHSAKFTFVDNTLAQYVTNKDKEIITQIISSELLPIPLYHISNKIEKLDITKDKIYLKYKKDRKEKNEPKRQSI